VWHNWVHLQAGVAQVGAPEVSVAQLGPPSSGCGTSGCA
jgi:hypothetical protein